MATGAAGTIAEGGVTRRVVVTEVDEGRSVGFGQFAFARLGGGVGIGFADDFDDAGRRRGLGVVRGARAVTPVSTSLPVPPW